MLPIEIHAPGGLEHYLDLWRREECYRYYVKLRRRHCDPTELLDVWIHAPYCEECGEAEAGWGTSFTPDIIPATWAFDVAYNVSLGCLRRTNRAISRSRSYAWNCRKCSRPIRPWRNDSAYIATDHLEEDFGIPLTTPGRVNPARRLRDQIIKLYGGRCFGCRKKRTLHLDHIRPRSKGGDAAFRNLQPLCEPCGQMKGDADVSEVRVDDDMYFRPYPLDSYEGMFW